ncbi:MAG: carbohydrate ABC transporter permease [Thermotogae bacterium]|uniref:carbohydrate ABC transporter permease n=1 Tax=Kosmotoga sp. TaxID=1955248 RepID=UPI000F0EB0E5|nr:carbohydrate ABC transporter permease [Kosmotoga sp.]MCD6160150.1 carbohydrate ABC transporter permease [Kosmotoga sp.]RKX50953.1 MAG: carbohydrate ABC transporter permease [Thermotogota bacterium]
MSRVSKLFTYILLIIFTLFFLIPIYVLISTSFKPLQEVSLEKMWFLPLKASFQGFVKAFQKLSPNLKNSFILVIPATIISALVGSINGYVLSKIKFRGSNLLFTLILFGMFIPYQSVLFPVIRFLQSINLYGSIWGLVILHIIYGLPITTLIFRNYYAEVPTELIEAAHIDGAGIFKVYWKVLFPISLPGFVVVIIWQFTNIWNEFLFAVTVTSDPTKQPITVALVNLAGSKVVEWNVQMAGALLAALPTLLVYVLLGKYFLRGLLAGSVKG